MKIKGWKYYNHAAVPTTAPHEAVDLAPVENGDIWKIDGGKPLLVRWHEDFDCGYETEWWHVIKRAPYSVDSLSRSFRKAIRQADKKCCVKRVSFVEYTEEIYECYRRAVEKYTGAVSVVEKEFFIRSYTVRERLGVELWACFSIEEGLLIGYMTVGASEEYAEVMTSKYIPEYLHLGPSNLLHHVIYGHYLNERGKRYVASGARNISHETAIQDYLITRFECERAYSRLRLKYRFGIGILVKIIYPVRWVLKPLSGIKRVAQLLSVLRMEEIVRTQRRVDKKRSREGVR